MKKSFWKELGTFVVVVTFYIGDLKKMLEFLSSVHCPSLSLVVSLPLLSAKEQNRNKKTNQN